MNNSVRVQILECANYLQSIALHLKLMQAFSPPEELVETLVVAKFKEDIYVFCVLKEVLKLNYVLVMNRAMDFNLRHQLLLCSSLS